MQKTRKNRFETLIFKEMAKMRSNRLGVSFAYTSAVRWRTWGVGKEVFA
jgi:hypothetical protein